MKVVINDRRLQTVCLDAKKSSNLIQKLIDKGQY